MRISFYLSTELYDQYSSSLKDALTVLNDKKKADISFNCEEYPFPNNDILDIRSNPDLFLLKKMLDSQEEGANRYESKIFIPNFSVNLKGNYIWYSRGDPSESVLIVSSYIYKGLLEHHLDFASYLLLVVAQFIARHTVVLEEPHDISRGCLNDHCTTQIEILNVLNSKGPLCSECLKAKVDDEYYKISQQIFSFIKNGKHVVGPEPIQSNVASESLGVDIKPFKGYYYEFEAYMAKKSINLSDLYSKIHDLLRNPDSEIEGYSLYEVYGGWRGKIEINNAQREDLNQLKILGERHGQGAFKDLIKPMVEKNGDTFAIFDESSIVLKIIFKSNKAKISWDPKINKVIREIIGLFDKITRNEKSIYFTMKELNANGSIERIMPGHSKTTRIHQKIQESCEPGDNFFTFKNLDKPNQICELCGKNPIALGYILENAKTSKKLILGHECVKNFNEELSNLKKNGILFHFTEGRSKLDEFSDYDKDKEELENIKDLAPEGMGMDDRDWESEDNEANE